MKDIAQELKEHDFFKDFSSDEIEFIAGCGKNVVFETGEKVAREGDPADTFYLIRHGKLAIEFGMPGNPPIVCQTLEAGNICGWSWLFEPYQWSFDVVSLEKTRAIALNGKCLREKCHKDYKLGFHLMQKVARIFTSRLIHTRMQLMDVYGRK